MPVTDTLHPPPSSLSHTHSLLQCTVEQQWKSAVQYCTALQGLFFVCLLKCVSMPAHIVTVWRNETTCELFSQGDFMDRLIYSTAIHTILLVPLNPPSVFLNERLPLYLLSSPFSSALLLTTHSLPSIQAFHLPSQQGEMSHLRQGRRETELGQGIDRVVRPSRGVSS